MEKKFFTEIQKKMNVKTLNDFEKGLRTKIRDEFELERKTNENLARVLLVGESQMWYSIRTRTYSWVEIDSDRKEKLFKLRELYKEFYNVIESVEALNEKVKKIKKLKDDDNN